MTERHIEFFGPDLGRGPFSSQRIETSALQIATALAQLRTPLARSNADVEAHADFIRMLADRLAPDYAAYVNLAVGPETSDVIRTSIRVGLPEYSLLECWLADAPGGGVTYQTPGGVTWAGGVVLHTFTAGRHFLVITSETGIATVDVAHATGRDWYWAVSRLGRVYYSDRLRFV